MQNARPEQRCGGSSSHGSSGAFDRALIFAETNLFGYGFADTPEGSEVNVRGKPAEDLAGQWARATSSNS